MIRLAMIVSVLALAVSGCTPAASTGADAVLGADAEIVAYEASPTRCKGDHADEAFRTGAERFDAWRKAYDKGLEPPNGAFADAGMAFAYLYDKLRCRDGLVAYRYGNLLRLNKKEAKAIEILAPAEEAIRANYPAHLQYLFSVLGQASVSLGRADDAIRYYELTLGLDPSDVSTHLNLANQLIFKNRFDEAKSHISEARRIGLSQFGTKQADRLTGLIATRQTGGAAPVESAD